ncbi:MAG: XamI family restriction endonuclease [Lachnospiraceae bacterium]|nr:XamI family restriction endonuclease [Lachnospiraceae bacterium]
MGKRIKDKLAEELGKIVKTISKMIDTDVFVWIEEKREPMCKCNYHDIWCFIIRIILNERGDVL